MKLKIKSPKSKVGAGGAFLLEDDDRLRVMTYFVVADRL
jgi:hypothetical protein